MFLKKAFPMVHISRFAEKIKTKNKRTHKKHYVQAKLENFIIGEKFCYDGKLLELIKINGSEYVFSIVGSKKEITYTTKWIASHIKGLAHVVYERIKEESKHNETRH